MSAAPESIQRENLDRLQAELSTRQSTLLFAHASVTGVIALIVYGAAMKLAWDVKHTYAWALGVAIFAMVLSTYAILRYRDGRRVLKKEQARYEQLLVLRRELGLDDPSSLLPPQ